MTIPNGADFDDVAGLERHPSDRFRITHTGSFFGRRDPRPFLQALADSGLDVVARFLGDFRDADREWAAGLGLGDRLELLPYAPRAESLALQRDSEALLLLIPEAGGRGKGVLSGKVFEYVAVGRPILAAVPPDGAAAELIRETGAGVVAAPDDPAAIRAALEELHARWRDGGLPDVELSPEWRDRLSRRTRVEEMAAVLRATLDVIDDALERFLGSPGALGRLVVLFCVGVMLVALVWLYPAGVRRCEPRRAGERAARQHRSRARRRQLGAPGPGDCDRGAGTDPRATDTFAVAVGEHRSDWSVLADPGSLENYMRYFLLPRRMDPRRAVDPLLRLRPERISRARRSSGRTRRKGSRS